MRLTTGFALLAALVGVSYVAYGLHTDNASLKTQVSNLKHANTDPEVAIQKQTDHLIGQVGALMTLPQGETPTVANVSDADKARQESKFFADAQDGDKVLMYVKSGKAILYRPDSNKIVLVAPLAFDGAAAAAGTTAKTTPAATTPAPATTTPATTTPAKP